MATHQKIAGISDEDMVQRMIATHAERFGEAYWAFFEAHVAPYIPPQPVAVDVGCGPGLFLQDMASRYPQATLHGYDVTPAMIAAAQHLHYNGVTPTLALHDIVEQPLPLQAHSVHLLSMTAVLHVLDDPFAMLEEVARVLTPSGIFLLYDWRRTTLATYIAGRVTGEGAEALVDRQRALQLFPFHNKYTVEDWHWLLHQAGFTVREEAAPRPQFQIFSVRCT